MKYTLIYIVMTTHTSVTGKVEFNDGQICQAAADSIVKQANWPLASRYAFAWCFPEGVK